MEETEVKEKLETVLLKIFHDQTIKAPKCHTKFNKKKFKYISRRNILKGSCSVDFLGYEFWLSANGKAKIEIKYGITDDKRKKYEDRIDKLIASYTDPSSPDYNKMELLRHRIIAHTFL